MNPEGKKTKVTYEGDNSFEKEPKTSHVAEFNDKLQRSDDSDSDHE